MGKKTCTNCHCNCHCGEPLHSHHYDKDLCTCDNCECLQDPKDRANDLTYESNGGVVIDDTNECESCQ